MEETSVIAKFATTTADGKTYKVEYYNIEMITYIGYRVKSKGGIQFRIWAEGIPLGRNDTRHLNMTITAATLIL